MKRSSVTVSQSIRKMSYIRHIYCQVMEPVPFKEPCGGVKLSRRRLRHENLYCFSNFPPANDAGLETGGAAGADHQVAAGEEDDPHLGRETNFAVHLLLHHLVLSP